MYTCFIFNACRKAGEASAYSVFNENCEEIAGTFSGEKFDKQLRRGGGVM